MAPSMEAGHNYPLQQDPMVIHVQRPPARPPPPPPPPRPQMPCHVSVSVAGATGARYVISAARVAQWIL
jgi:hypothetical protein